MGQKIKLNYHRLWDTLDLGSYVTVSTDATIQEMIEEINAMHNRRRIKLQWRFPCLYQIDRSANDMPRLGDQLDEDCYALAERHQVSRYWPDASKIDPERIQLLLNAGVVAPIGSQHPRDTLSDLPSTFRNMQLEHNKTVSWFRNCQPPSETACSSNYRKQQNQGTAPVFNGRPVDRTGLPIQLFHPVFDHFFQALEAPDEPTAFEYNDVQQLAFAAQDVYTNEKERWESLIPFFDTSLDRQIMRDTPLGNWTSLCCTIIKVENEVGTGNCDPGIQAAEDYGILWSMKEVSSIRESCCCPALLIAIAGPHMCIFGAIYLGQIVVQQLTDYVWLGHHPQHEPHLRRLTRLFCTVKDTITELLDYYTSISSGSPGLQDPMRFFPHVRKYSNDGGQITDFTYTGFINDSTSRPTFTAVTGSGKQIIVKFAEQYNFDAHMALAEKELAPALLSYQPPGHSRGLHCIIMERVQAVSLHEWRAAPSTNRRLEGAQKDVQRALEILHNNNWVFGDLRSPNVLVIEKEESTRGMLVDFDWCGEHGVGRYPATMNDDARIGWPDGAGRRGLMMKQHDLDMFQKLFK
ncbi:Tyrosine kinase [Ceratobasidium sp. AG-Ba]|nr:Tyrosine kinase [Ceratobasidium sp. AG-Ba]